jgi:hypothetical protein
VLGGASAAAAAPTLPSQDPFYSYSGSLARVAPGTVLKTRSVTISNAAMTVPFSASQVLYRTTGELGQPTLAVATVIKPLVAAPAKVVSYQAAYDGLGSQCDPSFTLQGGSSGTSTASAEEQVIMAYVAAGDTVVVPDYEGIDLEWGAGQTSGYSTLDGIRAAEQMLGVGATSTPVALVGYSGGSIATEFATELQPAYAPSLDLVGAAEGGIPVDSAHNLSYINGSQSWSGVIPAVLVGLARAFKIDISKYSSPYGIQVAGQVKDECIGSFYGNYPGLTIQHLLKPRYRNFFAIPQIARITNHLTMSTSGTPKVPLFIGVGNSDGTGDGVMIARDDQELAHIYCGRGVPVQFKQYTGQDHIGAAFQFEPAAVAFVSERLAGMPFQDGCGSITAGNSLAPLPVLEVRVTGQGAISLRTSSGMLGGVVVRIRGGHRVLRSSPRRVTHAWKTFLQAPSGRDSVTVTEAGTTLYARHLTIR